MRAAVLVTLVAAAACRDAPPPMALRLAYEVDTDAPEVIAATARVMQARLDRVHSHGTARAAGDRVVVELPALDPDRVLWTKELIARGGRFAVREVDDGAAVMAAIAAHAHDDPEAGQLGIQPRVDVWHDIDGDRHHDQYLTATDRHTPPHDVVRGRDLLQIYVMILDDDPATTIPDDRMLAFELVRPAPGADDRAPYWRSYYVVRRPALDGRAIAGARAGRDSIRKGFAVWIRFDDAGRRALDEVTHARVGHKLTVEIDDVVTSAPVVMEPITGGRLELTLGGGPYATRAEAAQLAAVLATGPLPAAVIESSAERIR